MSTRYSLRLLKKSIDKATVLVFDLDDTLYLHKVCEASEDYHREIKQYLRTLKLNNKTLCIASHHSNPTVLLEKINIKNLFEHIIFEKKKLNGYINNISEYTNKKDMILEIMQKTNCRKEDIIFFDDNIFNILQVESMNVRCVLVGDTGIEIDRLR